MPKPTEIMSCSRCAERAPKYPAWSTERYRSGAFMPGCHRLSNVLVSSTRLRPWPSCTVYGLLMAIDPRNMGRLFPRRETPASTTRPPVPMRRRHRGPALLPPRLGQRRSLCCRLPPCFRLWRPGAPLHVHDPQPPPTGVQPLLHRAPTGKRPVRAPPAAGTDGRHAVRRRSVRREHAQQRWSRRCTEPARASSQRHGRENFCPPPTKSWTATKSACRASPR